MWPIPLDAEASCLNAAIHLRRPVNEVNGADWVWVKSTRVRESASGSVRVPAPATGRLRERGRRSRRKCGTCVERVARWRRRDREHSSQHGRPPSMRCISSPVSPCSRLLTHARQGSSSPDASPRRRWAMSRRRSAPPAGRRSERPPSSATTIAPSTRNRSAHQRRAPRRPDRATRPIILGASCCTGSCW